jgi:chloramphenicol-sensitive protein RarD
LFWRESVADSAARYRSGLAFGLIAYGWWGLVPLYFAQLKDLPAGEILAHRIVWSLPIMLGLTALAGGWADLFRVLRDRKLVLVLLASSTLLAVNWLLYIYATVTNRVAEASLGYFMMPLVNAALATAFLGEKLRPAHYPALSLVALGVAIPSAWNGYFPWLAVSVTVSFGFYGLIRKKVPVESSTGLTVETLLLTVPSLAYLVYLAAVGQNHLGSGRRLDALIAVSGVITVVPLLAFTLSLRRLPLLAVSFLQFVAPTVQMLLAVGVLGETLTPDKLAAFVCIWAAVLIFLGDALRQARELRRKPNAHPPHRVGAEVVTR